MSQLSSHTRLRGLYNKYLYLDDKAFYDKVRFYEQNEQDVYNMRLEDSLWIQSGYLEAIFKISDYKKYIAKSQELLERLIFQNISYFNGEDLYEETLQRRAVAFYHLRDYTKSIHISQELLKINPCRKDTPKVLFFAMRSSFVRSLKVIKAGLMSALLSSAMILLFYQIVVVSFFPDIAVWFLQLISAIFIPIFIILICSKVAIDIVSFRKVNRWVKTCSEKKTM